MNEKVTTEEQLLLDAVDSYTQQDTNNDDNSLDFVETSKELLSLYDSPDTSLALAVDELTTAHQHINKFCAFVLALKRQGGNLSANQSTITLMTSMSAHLAYITDILKNEMNNW